MWQDTVDLGWNGDGRAVGDGPWAFGSKNPDFVQSPSVSKDCPTSVQFHISLTIVTSLWYMLPNYEYLTVTRSLTCDQMLLRWPDTVDRRWVGNGRAVGNGPWAFHSINPDYVQTPSVSKDCPISVQFHFFTFKSSKCEPWALFPKSKVCQEIVQRGKMPYFQFVWTDFWQSLDLPVKTVSKRL